MFNLPHTLLLLQCGVPPTGESPLRIVFNTGGSHVPAVLHWLLHCGSLQAQAAPAWVPCGVTSPAGKPAPAWAPLSSGPHLCQGPLHHRIPVSLSLLRASTCCVGPPQAAGGSLHPCGPPPATGEQLLHHGLRWNLSSSAWSTSCPFFCTDLLSAEIFCSQILTALFSSGNCTGGFPFPKILYHRVATSIADGLSLAASRRLNSEPAKIGSDVRSFRNSHLSIKTFTAQTYSDYF